MIQLDGIMVSDPRLESLSEKISAGERLSREDGMVLEETGDLHCVCMLADSVRRRLHGKRTGYAVNVHINYTNICVSGCGFCAFGRAPGSDGTYVLSRDEAVERVPDGVDEIHLVGGVNPDLSLDYFVELLRALKAAFPAATLKALTAIEIHALAKREGLEVEELLRILRDAGLGMLPGGGAEIFDERIRRRICPVKATGEEWLDVHRVAHKLGIPSNTTMLYGHVEKPEHRVDHLLRLRELQDEAEGSAGVIAHIPLPYLPGGTDLGETAGAPNGSLDLRQTALARLMLDNIPHIKAYWRALGIRMAQAALTAGADDLDGTVGREEVMHEAGSDAPRSLAPQYFESIIRGAGLEPYRRDSFHRPVKGDTR